MSPVALQVVEASGAGLAPELPPGLLDHMIRHHGPRLLAAGAQVSPAYAEEVQGGGTGGAEAGAGSCAGAGRPVPQGGYLGTDPLLPAEEGQTEEELAAPVLPEAEHLRHAHAEHQGDPEGGAAGFCPGPGGELHLEAGHTGQVYAAPGPDGQPVLAAALAHPSVVCSEKVKMPTQP